MLGSDSALASSAQTYSASWALQDHVEIHAENTSEGVILDAQINVLLDSKSEASGVREVSFSQFSVLYFKSSFKDFVGFLTSHGYMGSDFFIPLNSEASDSVSGP